MSAADHSHHSLWLWSRAFFGEGLFGLYRDLLFSHQQCPRVRHDLEPVAEALRKRCDPSTPASDHRVTAWRGSKHAEQTHGVRTIAVNQFLGSCIPTLTFSPSLSTMPALVVLKGSPTELAQFRKKGHSRARWRANAPNVLIDLKPVIGLIAQHSRVTGCWCNA